MLVGGVFFTKKRITKNLLGICLSISSASTLNSFSADLLDVMAIRRGQEILSEAQRLQSPLSLMEKHLDNKVVKLVYEMVKLDTLYFNKLIILLDELSLNELSCTKVENKLEISDFAECEKFLSAKLQKQKDGFGTADVLLRDREIGQIKLLEKLSVEVPLASKHTVPSMEDGLRKGQLQLRSKTNQTINDLIEYTSAFGELFSYLVSINGRVAIDNGVIVFSDQNALGGYNRLQSAMISAREKWTCSITDFKASPESNFNKLTK